MNKSEYRGRKIELRKKEWFYSGTDILVSNDIFCRCGHCGLDSTKEDHDGCIGELKNVINACCGHGISNDAYVQLSSGVRLGGAKAIEFIKINKQGKS
jgi:hypothetical protein